jgi:hypothetical protein
MRNFYIAILTLGLCASASAHHSFAAEYDSSKPVTLSGTVTRIEWKNPHSYVYIDVKSADGKVVNWGFEGYPPNTLRRVGFTRDLLKMGDTISVNGWRARDGSNQFAAREITFSNGSKFFFGPASN